MITTEDGPQINSNLAQLISQYKQDNTGDNYAFRLSMDAGTLLTKISELDATTGLNSVTYTEGLEPAVAKRKDKALAELIHYRLVKFKMDGITVIATPAGLNAVDRRFGLVYPFGKDGTIATYNRTLMTMSPSAKNAFIRALARMGPSFFDHTVEKRPLASLMQMFDDIQVWKRLPEAVNVKMFNSLRSSLVYYLDRKNPSVGADYIEQELEFWGNELNERIIKGIESLDDFVPGKTITFDNYELVELSISNQNQEPFSLIAKVKDAMTGEKSEISFYDLNPAVRCEILRQTEGELRSLN